MKISKAINAAMKEFDKANKEGDREIRTIALQEGWGHEDSYRSLTIKIEYAINGDYTESDKKPFIVTVYDNDGTIATEVEGRGE